MKNPTKKIDRRFLQRAKEISTLLRDNPPDIREKMESLGFEWVDDGHDPQEEMEETRAMPLNSNQESLVSYFEGQSDFTGDLLRAFSMEKESEEPNYPLFRRYFKKGNRRLKELLIEGLKGNPTDRGLLADLWFFHEHKPILGELIAAYLAGCGYEKHPKKFERLVQDFYENTSLYGYDAFHVLEESADLSEEKRSIVRRLREKENSGKPLKITRF